MKNNKALRYLAELVVIGMVVQLLVICYVGYSSYTARVDLIESQRAGCERGKLDRSVNAQGWRIAEKARRDEKQTDTAIKYAAIATSLEQRALTNCQEAFPDAELLP